MQDRYGYFWEEEEVNTRLEKKMFEAFDDVLQTSLKYKVDLRTAAYIVAIYARRHRHQDARDVRVRRPATPSSATGTIHDEPAVGAGFSRP